MIVGRCAYCEGAVVQLAVTTTASCPCGRATIPTEFLLQSRQPGHGAAPAPLPLQISPVDQLQLELTTG